MTCKPFTKKNNFLSKKDSVISKKAGFIQKFFQMKKILAKSDNNEFDLLAHDNIRLIYGKCR